MQFLPTLTLCVQRGAPCKFSWIPSDAFLPQMTHTTLLRMAWEHNLTDRSLTDDVWEAVFSKSRDPKDQAELGAIYMRLLDGGLSEQLRFLLQEHSLAEIEQMIFAASRVVGGYLSGQPIQKSQKALQPKTKQKKATVSSTDSSI